MYLFSIFSSFMLFTQIKSEIFCQGFCSGPFKCNGVQEPTQCDFYNTICHFDASPDYTNIAGRCSDIKKCAGWPIPTADCDLYDQKCNYIAKGDICPPPQPHIMLSD